MKFPVSSSSQPGNVCQVTWLWTLSCTPSSISISPCYQYNDTINIAGPHLDKTPTAGQVAVAPRVQNAGHTPLQFLVEYLIQAYIQELTASPWCTIEI